MIICVANTSPSKVKKQFEKKGIAFSMWKPDTEIDPDTTYGFFNFDDLRAAKVKRTPVFFNIVSAFGHIAINHPIYRYDFKEMDNGMVFFHEPKMNKVAEHAASKFSTKSLNDVMFKPAKVSSHDGSELARRWNNFVLTLPSCVAETFMVCFLTCVRENDKEKFQTFVVDNRLVGTANKAAYQELQAIIACMWAVMHACAMKTENMEKLRKSFIKKNKALESSLSRFLFWNKSYKGKELSDYLDDENNVSQGIKE